MLHFTAQGKKIPNRACFSQTTQLTPFELTCCKHWDMKSVLAGQHEVIYQVSQVYFLCKVSRVSLQAFGAGAAFCTSLHYHCLLVLDSTQNCSTFPECWFGFPYQCNKGSQTKGFFLCAPQCLMITLSSQWTPSTSHMALTPC